MADVKRKVSAPHLIRPAATLTHRVPARSAWWPLPSANSSHRFPKQFESHQGGEGEAIHAAATDDSFDGVGDDFARHERILHAFAAHRDAVGDGDGVKDNRLATASVRTFLGFNREFINVHVARRDVAPGGRDADDGLLEIGLGEADGIKHGARSGAFRAVHKDAGERTHGILCGNLFHPVIVVKNPRRGKAEEFNVAT